MSTPNLVPVISSDGSQKGQVDPSELAAAQQAGWRKGIRVFNGNQQGLVAEDEFPAAQKAGWKQVQLSQSTRDTMSQMASQPMTPQPLNADESAQLKQSYDNRPLLNKILGLGPTDQQGQYLQNKMMQSQKPGIEAGLRDYYATNPAGMYGMGIAKNAAQAGQDFSQGNVKKGLHNSVKAVGIAASPLAIPAIAANPLATMAAIGTGALGSQAASGVTKELGGSQDAQDLAGDIGGLAGGTLGGLGTKAIASRLPSKGAAGALFNQVSGAAGDIPIDVTAPGNSALKAKELAQAGGRMPKVINDFIRRTTDPNQPPLTYDEARNFYSNASRISSDEAQRLTPVMRRQLVQFTRDLGDSIGGAADQGGVLPQYQGAMKQYRQAAQLQDSFSNVGNFLSRQAMEKLPWLAAAYGAKKLVDGSK